MLKRIEKSKGPNGGPCKKHIYECDVCHGEFSGYKRSLDEQHYCSKQCFITHTKEKSTVECTCEICGKKWKTRKSYVTRTCSRECGAKLNPCSSKDESTWVIVKCEVCETDIHKRKIHTGERSFCSRNCLSIGFSKSHSTHRVKQNIAKGIVRGTYLSLDGREIKYDSSYELRRMREYDYLLDKDLLSWKRSTLSIPWIDDLGKKHHYNPDFELTFKDGSIVIEEIKGINDENSIKKAIAAREFCEKNNLSYRLFNLQDFENRLEIKTKVYKNDYGIFCRPTLEFVFMSMAHSLAARSTCLRKKVGVVFTDPKMSHAYCLGYNGDEAGGKNQCESLLPGKCNCIHAEINALTKNNQDLAGCTCFITLAPCSTCAKILINRQVGKVIYDDAYRDSAGVRILREKGIEVIRYRDLQGSVDDTL